VGLARLLAHGSLMSYQSVHCQLVDWSYPATRPCSLPTYGAAGHRAQPGRVRADTGLDDVADDHGVDLLAGDPGPVKRGGDRGAGQLGRRQGRERPGELADRSARPNHNDWLRHGAYLLINVHLIPNDGG
jgi:hypothetical protein